MGELNDYSVCTTWAIIDRRVYLLDVVRQRLELPTLKRMVIDEADRWKADRVLIEDKGSGTGLLQELQASGFWKAKPVIPKGDKGLRLGSITPIIEDGRVFLPTSAAWLDDYVYELCGFPGLKHDDQVDSTSQFLAWFREEGEPGGLYRFYEQEFERQRAMAEDRTVHLRAPAGMSHFVSITGDWISLGSDGTVWLTEKDAGSARQAGFADVS